MPVFHFTSPDGKNYEITGPDGATQEQAFGMLQQQLKAQPAASPAAAPQPQAQPPLTAGRTALGAAELGASSIANIPHAAASALADLYHRITGNADAPSGVDKPVSVNNPFGAVGTGEAGQQVAGKVAGAVKEQPSIQELRAYQGPGDEKLSDDQLRAKFAGTDVGDIVKNSGTVLGDVASGATKVGGDVAALTGAAQAPKALASVAGGVADAAKGAASLVKGTGADVAGAEGLAGSPLQAGRALGFKYAPSDVASRAPADAIAGEVPGIKREGLVGSPEVRKTATLENTANATKVAGKFLKGGENVTELTPKLFDDAQQPDYAVYKTTGDQVGAGKTGSADFQQALTDAVADQRPQAVLAPKVSNEAQRLLAAAKSGNLSGPNMVQSISWLRANGGRAVANAVEDELERQVAASNPTSDMVGAFRDARTHIAQVRQLQDATTGGQIDLQALRRAHEKTNGAVFTGPLKVMAEAAAAAPGSMRLPIGGVGSTVKAKSLYEAGKNAVGAVAKKVIPGVDPLGETVQNRFGSTGGFTDEELANYGRKPKKETPFELSAPEGHADVPPSQLGMALAQGRPLEEQYLQLKPPEGEAGVPPSQLDMLGHVDTPAGGGNAQVIDRLGAILNKKPNEILAFLGKMRGQD